MLKQLIFVGLCLSMMPTLGMEWFKHTAQSATTTVNNAITDNPNKRITQYCTSTISFVCGVGMIGLWLKALSNKNNENPFAGSGYGALGITCCYLNGCNLYNGFNQFYIDIEHKLSPYFRP